ncbi:RNF4 ligase, partial [Melanocharis versteri]|nr:RNF4 ligase [Melanocharis versteri]
RKRRGEADDSGQAQKRSRLLAPSTGGASEPEAVDLEESGTLSFELAGEEFIGVTAYSPESEDINLTGNDSDSVVLWEQNQELPLLSIPVDDSLALLGSDDDEELRDNDGYVTDKVSLQSLIYGRHVLSGSVLSSAWPAGTIRCPICMDFYPQIVQSGRLILSTLCGHVFCSQCLPFALQTASFCPTCRTELTPVQYHPIYI